MQQTVASSAGLTKTTDVDEVLRIALTGDPVSVVAAYKKFLEVGSSPMIDEDV